MKRTIHLRDAQQGHKAYTALWMEIKATLIAGQKLVVSVKPETRSLEQNDRMWALLTDVSEQVDWYGKKLTPLEWKHVISAALWKQKVVPGIDGGFVVLGLSTSKLSRSAMSDLQTLIEAFGAERGVRFSAPEE